MNALLQGNDNGFNGFFVVQENPVMILKSTVEMPLQNASYVLMNSLIQ